MDPRASRGRGSMGSGWAREGCLGPVWRPRRPPEPPVRFRRARPDPAAGRHLAEFAPSTWSRAWHDARRPSSWLSSYFSAGRADRRSGHPGRFGRFRRRGSAARAPELLGGRDASALARSRLGAGRETHRPPRRNREALAPPPVGPPVGRRGPASRRERAAREGRLPRGDHAPRPRRVEGVRRDEAPGSRRTPGARATSSSSGGSATASSMAIAGSAATSCRTPTSARRVTGSSTRTPWASPRSRPSSRLSGKPARRASSSSPTPAGSRSRRRPPTEAQGSHAGGRDALLDRARAVRRAGPRPEAKRVRRELRGCALRSLAQVLRHGPRSVGSTTERMARDDRLEQRPELVAHRAAATGPRPSARCSTAPTWSSGSGSWRASPRRARSGPPSCRSSIGRRRLPTLASGASPRAPTGSRSRGTATSLASSRWTSTRRDPGSILEVALWPQVEILEGLVRDGYDRPQAGVSVKLEGSFAGFIGVRHRTDARTDRRG